MDIELKRTPDDRRRYTLDGVGTLRLEGLFSGRATAEADAERWHITRHGFWRRLEATDAGGTVVGTFARPRLRGGGVCWHGREYALRRASMWRERYALLDGDHQIALLDARGWGKRPVRITVDDPAELDAGLLLFTAFVVHTLAADANSAAAGASTAVIASSC